jgi:hypothetical protein
MRKVEKEIREAVQAGHNFKGGNTVVTCTTTDSVVTVSMTLHGNEIYRKVGAAEYFTLAGWNTFTTRGRLRAMGIPVRCFNFSPMFGSVEIDLRAWYLLSSFPARAEQVSVPSTVGEFARILAHSFPGKVA